MSFDGLIKNGRFRIYELTINNQSLEKLNKNKNLNFLVFQTPLKTKTNTCGFEIFAENFLDSENS